jgi:hypothetical protein
MISTGAKLTIYANLFNRLKRDPTHEELKAEVKRILDEALAERRKAKK